MAHGISLVYFVNSSFVIILPHVIIKEYKDTKTTNFPFVPNGELIVLRCPSI